METTKYQRIAELAGTYAAAFMAHRAQCAADAHSLLTAAETYFGAPEMAFRLVSLDAGFQTRLAQPKHLELIRGLDAYWYFGLALKFEGSHIGFSEATFTVGLKRLPREVLVRLSRDIRLSADSGEGWNPVLKEIEDGLLQHYQSPVVSEQRPLGFVPR